MDTAVNGLDILNEAETGAWNESAVAATCRRCGGLMVLARYTDCWDDADNVAVRRCVQCGEVVDPVILHNRHAHGAAGFIRNKN
jgi:hypothetical protein